MFRIMCVCVFDALGPIRGRQLSRYCPGRRRSTTCSAARTRCIILSFSSCLWMIPSFCFTSDISQSLQLIVTWWRETSWKMCKFYFISMFVFCFVSVSHKRPKNKEKQTTCTAGFTPTTQDFTLKYHFLYFKSKKKQFVCPPAWVPDEGKWSCRN